MNDSLEVSILLRERRERIQKAIALERPDRTPVVLLYGLFAARILGMSYYTYCTSLEDSLRADIEAFRLCGNNADGSDYFGMNVYGSSYSWLSKVRIPGIHLLPDVPYQVVESPQMSRSDYDEILKIGWSRWYDAFMKERILIDADPEHLPERQAGVSAAAAAAEYGIPILTDGVPVFPPFEMLCGARSMTEFVHDLYRIPDKVQSVMDHMVEVISGPIIEKNKARGVPCVWVAGVRSGPEMLTPRQWERFSWPYIRRIVHDIVDAGLVAILHLDSDWTRELHRFTELPEKKCIFAPDGRTYIF